MPAPRPLSNRLSSRIAGAAARVEITGAAEPTAEAPARFRMVAYTGEPMRISHWADPVVVDLETADVSQQRIPALYDHYADLGSVVGQVETLGIENQQLVASGRFTPLPSDPNGRRNCAADVLALAKVGYQWQASVGADPATVEEIKPGAIGIANWGRQYPGPCVIGRGCQFKELSFVVLGGDRRTSVVTAHIKGAAAMTYEEWIASMAALFGGDAASMDEAQTAAAKIIYQSLYPNSTAVDPPAEPVVAADPAMTPQTEEEKKKAEEAAKAVAAIFRGVKIKGSAIDYVAELRRDTAAEMNRQSAIQALAKKYDNPEMPVGNGANARRVSVAAHAIAENWSIDKAHLEMINRDRPSGVHLHIPGSGPALQGAAGNRIIEAALCTALGQKNVEKQFKESELDAAHKNFRGRIGLHQVMMMAAAQNGYHCGPGERVNAGNVRDVLRAAFPAIRAASTVSLPGIFANVANKELLTGYMEEDQTWREIAKVNSVSDFKAVTSYRLLDNMAYEQVGADGKIKHGSVSEESYTRQANTYAKMFALTRRDLINDDLGAFSDLRNRLGRGAAQKFNDVFWAKFLYDHATFFTTARTNYITGATTTLLTDGVGLSLGVKAFRVMTSPSGDGTKRVGGNPEILLVPPELEAAAEGLYVNQNLNSVKTSDANIYANKYRPVVCAWLSDSAFTGYSTTAWYLLRNPAVMPAVVASFLNGMESPTVEDSDADFDTLGVQFRGYHDFGVDQAEYLCGIKSKGAA